MDHDTGAQPGLGELVHRLIGHQPPRLQGEHLVRDADGVLGALGSDEDGAALGGELTQQPVEPGGLPGRQAPCGLVEHQGVRIPEKSDGDPETTLRPGRQITETLVRQIREADHVEHHIGAGGGHPGRCTEHPQMPPHGAAGMPGDVLEENADLMSRAPDAVQGAAPEEGGAMAPVELQQKPQRGGLARAWAAEQCGDPARRGLEGEVVDNGRLVAAGVLVSPVAWIMASPAGHGTAR